mgnify:CR=1 FL=1
MITSKTHSFFDYFFSLFLMLSPWLLGFGEAQAETLAPVIIGMVIVSYSFFTDYEGGMYRRIPYNAHLTFDLLLGIVMAASPWLFDFNEKVFKPHLVIGIFMVAVAFFSFNLMSFIRFGSRKSHPSAAMNKIQLDHPSRLRTN